MLFRSLVTTDSFLRLIDPAVREALERGTPIQRRAFAISCAELVVDRLDDADALLRSLQQQTVAAMGTARAPAIDELLRGHEERAHEAILRLRTGSAAAPSPTLERASSFRHAVTALRAMLVPDSYVAAARVAFQAVCATRDVDAVLRLSQELCG